MPSASKGFRYDMTWSYLKYATILSEFAAAVFIGFPMVRSTLKVSPKVYLVCVRVACLALITGVVFCARTEDTCVSALGTFRCSPSTAIHIVHLPAGRQNRAYSHAPAQRLHCYTTRLQLVESRPS